MRHATSYKVKIVGHSDIFKDTLSIYRNALSYVVTVVNGKVKM